MTEVVSSVPSDGVLSYDIGRRGFSQSESGFSVVSMDLSEQGESIAGSTRSTNCTLTSTLTTRPPKKSLKVNFTPSTNFKDGESDENDQPPTNACVAEAFSMDSDDKDAMIATNSDDWFRDRSSSLTHRYDALEALTAVQMNRQSVHLSLGERTEVHSLDVQDARKSLSVSSLAGSPCNLSRSTIMMRYDALDWTGLNSGGHESSADEHEDETANRRDSWLFEDLGKTTTTPTSTSVGMMHMDSEVPAEPEERTAANENLGDSQGVEAQDEEAIPGFPPVRVSQARLTWRKSTDLQLQRISNADVARISQIFGVEDVADLTGASPSSSSSSAVSVDGEACSHCGHRNSPTANFCENCGNRIAPSNENQKSPEHVTWETAWSQQQNQQPAYGSSSSSRTSSRDSLQDEWGWKASSAPASESEDGGHKDVPTTRKTRSSSESSKAPKPNVFWQIFTGQLYDLCCTGDRERRASIADAPRVPPKVRLESPPAIPDILRKSLRAQAEHPT